MAILNDEPDIRLYTVTAADAGLRLDIFLANACGDLTRSGVQKLIETRRIQLNAASVSKSERVKVGDVVTLSLPAPEPLDLRPENIPLSILYEDKDVIVVEKPRGMVVHQAPGHADGTLVHALLYHCDSLSGLGGAARPGVVHRIDKDTSGILAFAKTDRAYIALAAQFSAHSVDRIYHAVAVGAIAKAAFTIDAPIGRHPGRHPVDRKKMAVTSKNGRRAITHIQVLENICGCTYVLARLETGRTHQIRVHMASIGHPLLGDTLYGGAPLRRINGQILHAKRLGFEHPTTGQWLTFETELPDYFEEILLALRAGKK